MSSNIVSPDIYLSVRVCGVHFMFFSSKGIFTYIIWTSREDLSGFVQPGPGPESILTQSTLFCLYLDFRRGLIA